MKTTTAAMAAALASGAPRLVKMLQVILKDGTVLGFTDHDEEIEYDLADGLGIVGYSAGQGVLISNIVLQAGFSPDNFEFSGPIRASGPITLPAVLGGRFNGAQVKLFEVKWDDLTAGALKWLKGDIQQARPEGSVFTADVRSLIARFAQVVGRQIIPSCDADHGDARCKRVVETETVTVGAVTDDMEFDVTYPGDWPTGYFDKGKVEWQTGALAGTEPVNVERWTQSAAGAANVVMFRQLAEAPAPGDTATIKRGCGKTRLDCIERDNMVNFRGHPETPGNDKIFQAPTPGAGGA